MRFYVNIDHVATVREARRTDEPDPVRAAVLVELAGADGFDGASPRGPAPRQRPRRTTFDEDFSNRSQS